jgi:prepilin-type processing-associated H-X9-DG protein
MRSKEEAHDYRYFPEPDLPPVLVSPELVERLRATLPELPRARAARYQQELGLSPYDAALRSYIMNGWNDYWQEHGTNVSVGNLNGIVGTSMPESAIREPSETILFGEKQTESPHYYMDFLETASGNDFDEVEHGRHMGLKTSGGSNYAFADGSARYLRYGRAVSPLNLWAVTDSWRKSAAPGF